jgi:hypothetical protein
LVPPLKLNAIAAPRPDHVLFHFGPDVLHCSIW